MASLTQLDLAGNKLCGVDEYGNGTYDVTGIKAISDALRGSASLTSLNLSSNRLCSFWKDVYGRLQGTYDTTGIQAISDALKGSTSMTEVRALFSASHPSPC